jgi:DNA-directed RNA polymerase specialized sigma24 family protein
MRRDGRSYAEISTELGISRGTVGALVSRAVAKIRRHAKRPA